MFNCSTKYASIKQINNVPPFLSGYDDTYQLTSAENPTLPDEAFTYDKVGNRMTSLDVTGAWSYNGNNELIGHSAATYEYDANGNTVKKIEGGQVTTYVYNARNRLEKVYLPDGRMASYAYDPFGRRVRKQVGNEVMYFAYADEGLVGEYDVSGSLEKSARQQNLGVFKGTLFNCSTKYASIKQINNVPPFCFY